MFIGHFTERPYQDPNSGYFGSTGLSIKDLTLSNETYDPSVGRPTPEHPRPAPPG